MANKSILVVDDERDFLKIISSRIESWGHKVISVSSGSEALTVIKDKKPDIVILDYMMPDMDGIATLKKIRHIDKKLPVIMFTAYPNEETIKGAEKLGVAAFVPKLSMFSDTQEALREAISITGKGSSK